MTTVAVPTARSASCSTAVGADRTLVDIHSATKNADRIVGDGWQGVVEKEYVCLPVCLGDL